MTKISPTNDDDDNNKNNHNKDNNAHLKTTFVKKDERSICKNDLSTKETKEAQQKLDILINSP